MNENRNMSNEVKETSDSNSVPQSAATPTFGTSPTTLASTTSLGTIGSFTRRLSSILPSYIRRKSGRKDSIFASESTTSLWPFYIEEKLPTIFGYKDSNVSEKDNKFKFGWINGVYV